MVLYNDTSHHIHVKTRCSCIWDVHLAHCDHSVGTRTSIIIKYNISHQIASDAVFLFVFCMYGMIAYDMLHTLSLLIKFFRVQHFRRLHHEPTFPNTRKGTPYKGEFVSYRWNHMDFWATCPYDTYPLHRQAVLIVIFIGCCRCPCLYEYNIAFANAAK